ncbi:MAG: hypothetical protein BWY01_00439 [Synergistetes bacterium ADurb.Bin155]|nr:MAG: hypothetical protein BWY01_00439 [Synergistetes bacterium ADurb.Bin155]
MTEMAFVPTLVSVADRIAFLAAQKDVAHCETLKGPVIKTARQALGIPGSECP